MDGQADAEALTPERAAEILRGLAPLQHQAIGLYVNHVLAEERERFNAYLQEQLKAQEERLNADFLAELTKRTAPDPDEPDDDLYTSRDAVERQVLEQAARIDHRELFAQQHVDAAPASLSATDVEQIAERVAHSVFQRLATPAAPVQGPHYVNGTPLPAPSFRRPSAYVPSTIRR